MRDAAGEACHCFHLLQSRNALCKTLPVGDITEAPHAPDTAAADALRLRIALEGAAILELENVEALGFALRVQLLDFREKLRGVAKLIEHGRDRRAVVSAVEDRGGNAP